MEDGGTRGREREWRAGGQPRRWFDGKFMSDTFFSVQPWARGASRQWILSISSISHVCRTMGVLEGAVATGIGKIYFAYAKMKLSLFLKSRENKKGPFRFLFV